jgi:hypothetical protein
MNDAQFKRLPRLVAACARAGWFQGTVLSALRYHFRFLPSQFAVIIMKRLDGIQQVLTSCLLGW